VYFCILTSYNHSFCSLSSITSAKASSPRSAMQCFHFQFVDPHIAPRLKKEYSNNSTSLTGLRSLFYGEIYIYFTLRIFIHRHFTDTLLFHSAHLCSFRANLYFFFFFVPCILILSSLLFIQLNAPLD
jgi:hypothetical protein